jgi:hypothetical protein
MLDDCVVQLWEDLHNHLLPGRRVHPLTGVYLSEHFRSHLPHLTLSHGTSFFGAALSFCFLRFLAICWTPKDWWFFTFFLLLVLNVMVESLMLLLRICKVSGSNLDLEIGYPAWGVLWFSSVTPGMCQDSTLNWATTACSRILSSSSFTYRPSSIAVVLKMHR